MSLSVFTIYKKLTGEIIQSGYCNTYDFFDQIVPNDCKIIPIASNPNENYILNDVVMNFPAKPHEYSVFNYETKEWVVDEQSIKNEVIQKRNLLLIKSDWTQIPNSPLTSEKQQLWSIYRQQLRDITLQSGYPFNVDWPIQP